MVRAVFGTLVFPGLAFTAVVGLVLSWVDRKVTARVQMRTGPRPLQPFYDVVKYFVKETCIPARGLPLLFLAAPLLGLAGVTLASCVLWRAYLRPESAFVGDLFVVLYLLAMPPTAVVLGAFASGNPIASIGGSREMKLMLAYELPLALCALVPVVRLLGAGASAAGSLRLGAVIAGEPAVHAPSGILALAAAIVCMQAKLTLVPFDIPEAETELTGGAYVEYSGPPFGVFRLTRAMMLFVMPFFLVVLFWAGPGLADSLKVVLLVVVTTLIRNTAPRLRIDQAVRFFWGPVTAVALLSVALALWGW